MKKFVYFILFSLVISSFSGCFGGEVQEDVVEVSENPFELNFSDSEAAAFLEEMGSYEDIASASPFYIGGNLKIEAFEEFYSLKKEKVEEIGELTEDAYTKIVQLAAFTPKYRGYLLEFLDDAVEEEPALKDISEGIVRLLARDMVRERLLIHYYNNLKSYSGQDEYLSAYVDYLKTLTILYLGEVVVKNNADVLFSAAFVSELVSEDTNQVIKNMKTKMNTRMEGISEVDEIVTAINESIVVIDIGLAQIEAGEYYMALAALEWMEEEIGEDDNYFSNSLVSWRNELKELAGEQLKLSEDLFADNRVSFMLVAEAGVFDSVGKALKVIGTGAKKVASFTYSATQDAAKVSYATAKEYGGAIKDTFKSAGKDIVSLYKDVGSEMKKAGTQIKSLYVEGYNDAVEILGEAKDDIKEIYVEGYEGVKETFVAGYKDLKYMYGSAYKLVSGREDEVIADAKNYVMTTYHEGKDFVNATADAIGAFTKNPTDLGYGMEIGNTLTDIKINSKKMLDGMVDERKKNLSSLSASVNNAVQSFSIFSNNGDKAAEQAARELMEKNDSKSELMKKVDTIIKQQGKNLSDSVTLDGEEVKEGDTVSGYFESHLSDLWDEYLLQISDEVDEDLDDFLDMFYDVNTSSPLNNSIVDFYSNIFIKGLVSYDGTYEGTWAISGASGPVTAYVSGNELSATINFSTVIQGYTANSVTDVVGTVDGEGVVSGTISGTGTGSGHGVTSSTTTTGSISGYILEDVMTIDFVATTTATVEGYTTSVTDSMTFDLDKTN